MLWVRDHEPAVFERSRYLLLPGSYMSYRLTGETAVDYSNASSTLLLYVKQKAWSQRMLRLTGLDDHGLGHVSGPTGGLGHPTMLAPATRPFPPHPVSPASR